MCGGFVGGEGQKSELTLWSIHTSVGQCNSYLS